MFFLYKLRIPDGINIKIHQKYITIVKNNFVIKKSKNSEIYMYLYNQYIYIFSSENNKLIIKNYLTILFNLIWGINKLFYKQLVLSGVGFKVQIQKNELNFRLGYSHLINFKIPQNIKIVNPKPQLLVIYGITLENVTQCAAKIRDLKLPEVFKGKGICYSTEKIKLKHGKKK